MKIQLVPVTASDVKTGAERLGTRLIASALGLNLGSKVKCASLPVGGRSQRYYVGDGCRVTSCSEAEGYL